MQNNWLTIGALILAGLLIFGKLDLSQLGGKPSTPAPALGQELLDVVKRNSGSAESVLTARDAFAAIAGCLKLDATRSTPRLATSGAVEDLRLITIELMPHWGLSDGYAIDFGRVVGPHLDQLGTSGGDTLSPADKQTWAAHYDAVRLALDWVASQL